MGSGSINMPAVFIADTIAIVILALMLYSKAWKTALNSHEKKYFIVLIITVMFSCIMDACTFYFDGLAGRAADIMIYVSNYWIFLSYIIIGPVWVMLVIAHITGEVISKFQKWLVIFMCTFGAILLFTNIFKPIIFSIDSNNVYQRESLYYLYMVIEAIFILDGTITYFVSRKKNPNLKHFPILQFILPFILGVVIQSVFYGVSTMMVFLTISICGIVIGLYNENEAEAEVMRERQKNLEIIAIQKEQLEKQQGALEDAVQMANSANQAKTAFLNNMSHDIRTPMNAIIGFTNLAQKHIDEKEHVEDYLGKIEQSSNHLLSLINDVLDMSRIESGKMSISSTSESIKDIMESINNIIHANITAKNQHLLLDYSSIDDDLIMVDRLRLNQILLNVISNSIKYTQENGEISIIVSQHGSNLGIGTYEFIIKDNGMGMSEEFLKTIFEPFARVNTSTVSKIQGTGLGMAITKKFIDLMGGTINIKSKENEGTETSIVFNFDIVNQQNEEQDVLAENYDFAGKKILLVDDNELNREIAIAILEENGFIVDSADDGTVAVDKVKKSNIGDYDIILMDVQMPIMNGYDATKAIRQLENKDIASIPIIAMTANAFEEDKKEALSAGMDDYLSKPINIDQMKKIIAKYV